MVCTHNTPSFVVVGALGVAPAAKSVSGRQKKKKAANGSSSSIIVKVIADIVVEIIVDIVVAIVAIVILSLLSFRIFSKRCINVLTFTYAHR